MEGSEVNSSVIPGRALARTRNPEVVAARFRVRRGACHRAALARTRWRRPGMTRKPLRRLVDFQHAAADLVFLDRFKQRLEIAFAESVVALALDEFEEDRPDGVGGKDLQQQLGEAAIDHAFAVDQDAVALEPRDFLAMTGQPRV